MACSSIFGPMEQSGVHLLRQETISSSDSGLRGCAEKGSEGQHCSRDDGEGRGQSTRRGEAVARRPPRRRRMLLDPANTKTAVGSVMAQVEPDGSSTHR